MRNYIAFRKFCISQIADVRTLAIQKIIQECQKINPDLIIIGPENYLSENLAGRLRGLDFNVFGPDDHGAKLESSKEFMKEFCQSHNIPTASSKTFTTFNSAKTYLEQRNGSIVVKYDGLAAGKGVFVCSNQQEQLMHATKSLKKKYLIKKLIRLSLRIF